MNGFIRAKLKLILLSLGIFIVAIASFVAWANVTKPPKASVTKTLPPQYGLFVVVDVDPQNPKASRIKTVEKNQLRYAINAKQIERMNAIKSDYSLKILDKKNNVILVNDFNKPELTYNDARLFGSSNSTQSTIPNQNDTKSSLIVPLTPGASEILLTDKKTGEEIDRKEIPQKINPAPANFMTFANSGSSDAVIAVVSSGFKPSEMQEFRTIAENIKNTFYSIPPLDRYASFLHFDLVETQNDMNCRREAAAGDLPGQERCAVCDNSKVLSTVAASGIPAWATTVVILNDPVYGGCASNGVSALTKHPASYIVGVHELGHSLFGLADEYSYGDTVKEPGTHSNCFDGIPPNPLWDGIVLKNAYFLGCTHDNWYRTSDTSIMRDVGVHYFNDLAKQLIAERFGYITEKPSFPNPSDGASKEEELLCENNQIRANFYYKPSTDPSVTSHEVRYFVVNDFGPNGEIYTILGNNGTATSIGFSKNIKVQWDVYACKGKACINSKNGYYQFNIGDPCKNPTPTPTQKISPTLKPSPTITPTVTPELDSFTDVCKGKGTLVDYLEARCGGLKYNQDDALNGKFFGTTYSDVYLCTGGESIVEYKDLQTCSNPPWSLKSPTLSPTNTPTPSPTVQAILTPKIGTTNTPAPKSGSSPTPTLIVTNTPAPTIPLSTSTPTPSPTTGVTGVCGTCSKLAPYYSGPTKYYYHEWGNNQCCAGAPNSCVNSSITYCPN